MRLFVLILMLCVMAPVAKACEITEEKIRALYAEMDQAFAPGKLDQAKVFDFYNKHLTDKSDLNANLETNVTLQPQTIELDKQKILAQLYQLGSSMTNTKFLTDVLSVKIDDDGNGALVEYYQVNDGTVDDVGFKSASSCRDRLMDKNGVLVLYKNICNVRITYDVSKKL